MPRQTFVNDLFKNFPGYVTIFLLFLRFQGNILANKLKSIVFISGVALTLNLTAWKSSF